VPRLTSTEMLPHFWMRHFLDVGSEEEVLLPGPLDLRIWYHLTFLHGGLLRTLCTAEMFELGPIRDNVSLKQLSL
jgi:hypothetical protein